MSCAFADACQDAEITVSAGRAGSCFDNAVIESFWSQMKRELGLDLDFSSLSLDEFRLNFMRWVWYYNDIRPHGSLGFLSPRQRRELVLRQVVEENLVAFAG